MNFKPFKQMSHFPGFIGCFISFYLFPVIYFFNVNISFIIYIYNCMIYEFTFFVRATKHIIIYYIHISGWQDHFNVKIFYISGLGLKLGSKHPNQHLFVQHLAYEVIISKPILKILIIVSTLHVTHPITIQSGRFITSIFFLPFKNHKKINQSQL